MQSRQFNHITVLAAAALLVLSSTEERVSCHAAESWEEHVFITPIPLVAYGRIPIARPKSKKLTSLTAIPVPFETMSLDSVFPLRWGDQPWQADALQLQHFGFQYERQIGPAPVFLQLVFSKASTETDDWWNAWGESAKRQLEWSPLRLAGLSLDEYIVPVPIVPHHVGTADQNWFRILFVLPHRVTENSLTEYEQDDFEFSNPFNAPPYSNLQPLREFSFTLRLPRPGPRKASASRRWRERHEYYTVRVVVDFVSLSKDVSATNNTERIELQPVLFDDWRGASPADEASFDTDQRVFTFGGVGVTR